MRKIFWPVTDGMVGSGGEGGVGMAGRHSKKRSLQLPGLCNGLRVWPLEASWPLR
jgi:hypothetical protein